MNRKYDLCSNETWMLNKPGNLFMKPTKICLPSLNTYRWRTHNCIPCYERIFALTAHWLTFVCGFGLCAIRSWNSHVWCFLGMKEILNLLQRCWVGTAGLIPWLGSSCSFTLLYIFWSNDTQHIYIRTFGILLTEGHTDIEHVFGPALFLDFTRHKVVIPFWHLG